MKSSFLSFLLVFLSFKNFGQTNIHLVKDINQNQKSSSISYLFSYNNSVYFKANTPEYGEEVWKSDGTENGTVLLKDIRIGAEGSSPHSFLIANGYLYFLADNKVWKSDGTENGTTIAINTNTDNICLVGNNLFYIGYTYLTGLELWKLNLINNTTSLVKDINTGIAYSYPTGMKNINGELYFSADNGINGYEPWKSDGTESGTIMIKDINVGSSSSLDKWQNSVEFIKVGINTFFFAKDASNGYELWKTDGTEANTQLVKNMYSGDTKGYIGIEFNNELYYTPKNPTNNWYELWKSDGTNAGTLRVDVGPLYHFDLKVLKNEIVYTKSYELWKTNGIIKSLIKSNLQNPSSGVIYTNKIYFNAESTLYPEQNSGVELWETDGTTVGTKLFKNIALGKSQLDLQSSSPSQFVVSNNLFFFLANDEIHGFELWKSDGTNIGTNLVKDIYQNGNMDSSPSDFFAIGEKFIFKAVKYSGNRVLNADIFVSEDSTGNIINSIFESEYPILNILSNNQTAFFLHGNYSYKLNSTLTGIEQLPFSLNSTDFSKAELNDEFYFTAHNFNLSNIRVYKMNNLGVSTPVHNNHYHASNLIKVNQKIFFKAHATNFSSGLELWQTDGTASGTYMIKDIYQGINSGIEYSSPFINHNGVLYFVANDGNHGNELWRSDGTNAGTYMIKDIHGGTTSSLIFKFVELNNKIYFLVDEGGALGKHLWVTDGTNAGTQLVSTFNNTWTQFDYFPKIEVANNLLFFSVKNGSYNGYPLWKSDGTNAGTVQVRDTQNNLVACNDNLLGVGNFLVFGGYYPLPGSVFYMYRFCKTDGTTSGTNILNNVSPLNFFKFKNKVFFAGNDDFIGYELWSMDILDCQTNRIFTSPTNDFNANAHKYEVTNGITATNKISGTANVVFDASKFIILNAGFQANSGTVFKAQIDGCGNN